MDFSFSQSHRDTIVAVSSPPGRSARGLVRVAGAGCASVMAAVTLLDKKPEAGVLIKTRLRSPLPEFACLVCFFLAPKSYTGDDILEIQCPGNPALLQRIVQKALASGARMAEPGEFTFRAFSSGKMDLMEAEGVSATISAVSDSQLEAAALLRGGKLSGFATELVNNIAQALALVEAGIDFVDQEDVVAISPRELQKRLEEVKRDLDNLLARSRSWSALDGLPQVVMVGAPSAGKSTLFNSLLGRSRAVASQIPGTTRDILEEPLKLETRRGAAEVMLVDLAGLEQSINKAQSGGVIEAVNQRAQEIAIERIKQADVVLEIYPAKDFSKSSVDKWQNNNSDKKNYFPNNAEKITVITKGDLVSGQDNFNASDADYLLTSAVTGMGLNELKQKIAKCVEKSATNSGGEKLALQPRHEHALRAARDLIIDALALTNAQQNNRQLVDMEIVAAAMRSALDELVSLGGRMSADDILGKIFSTFCVGK